MRGSNSDTEDEVLEDDCVPSALASGMYLVDRSWLESAKLYADLEYEGMEVGSASGQALKYAKQQSGKNLLWGINFLGIYVAALPRSS